VDGGTSRFDKKGIMYQAVCSGCGGNDDFSVTPGSWPKSGSDVNKSSNCNIGVFKFDFQMIDVQAIAVAGPNDTICVNGTIDFKNNSTNATSYTWDFGDGTPTTDVKAPSHQYTTAGNYTVTFIAHNNARCALSDTLKLKIVVLPIPVVNIGNDTSICRTINLTLDAGNPGCKYLWSTGATTQTIQATSLGVYWVKVSNGYCEDADTMEVTPGTSLPVNLPKITLCKSESAVLDAGNPGCDFLWSTGETSQTITVKDAGVYSVYVTAGICVGRDTTTVTVISLPNYTLDTTLCSGQSIKLKTNLSGATYNYNWSTGATTESITVDTTGLYWVDISLGKCVVRDTITVKFIPLPVVNLPTTLDICPKDVAKLDAGNPGLTYVWSTGATTQTIDVSAAGLYTVIVLNGKCFGLDSTNIRIIQPTVTQSTISLCNMESLTLTASNTATNSAYLWSTGATTSSINTVTPGVYWVRVTKGNCMSSDTITVIGTIGDGVIYIPNSFSPDNNKINDVFKAVGTDITSFHLSIFDRWGELIYETSNLKEGWDGYYKGVLVKNDVYVWVMDYKTACDEKNSHRRKGIVSVVR
jgi:gliding motility-associated-like protein